MSQNVNSLLAYANVQMASEAWLSEYEVSNSSGLITALVEGNTRASKFTSVQAAEFAQIWEVVEHKSNTTTGFSGTLFEVRADAPAELLERYGLTAGEQVLSFRSTEFADDAARDNQATNTLEVKEFGWAIGQISDMRAWFEDLQAQGKVSAAPLTVTGYSLGGHLAAAFNELFSSQVAATYTFNGAGVGNLQGSLDAVIDRFDELRNSYAALASSFTDPVVRQRFEELWPQYGGTGSIPDLITISDVNLLVPLHPEAQRLAEALQRARSVGLEAQRVNDDISNSGGADPADVALADIAATSLGYQLAVLLASESISAQRTDIPSAGWDAYDRPDPLDRGFANFFDVYGANDPSAVANSQWHYGQALAVFIEDQPLLRGNVLLSTLVATAQNAEVKLLVDDFSSNDFGDTHSLVLMIDSLSVQARLAQLDPTLTLERAVEVFQAASHLKANSTFLEQGEAEGNVLENVVNALAIQLGVSGLALQGNPDGNTWHEIDGVNGYDGRADLHERLALIDQKIASLDLAGQFVIAGSGAATGADARLDFGSFLALHTLSPFVLKAKEPTAQAALNTTWQQVHGDRYLAWASDKNASLNGDTDHDYSFSNQWMSDRATLLTALTRRNQINEDQFVSDAHAPQDRNIEWRFVDPALGESESFVWWNNTQNGAANALTTRDRQLIAFGGEQDDLIEGTNNRLGDRLYGGAGNDRLSGLGGTDHLEGNEGSDALDGGAGNDTLHGGTGNDTYVFQSGHGQDVIVDADGLGSLTFDGQTISVGERLSDGSEVWEDSTGRYRITRIDNETLRISAKVGQDSITIKNWSDGELGLVLGDDTEEPEVPQTSTLYVGDQRARRLGIEVQVGEVTPESPSYGRYDWGSTSWLSDGTLQGGVQEAGFADVISAAQQTQGVQMFGHGGHDALTGGSGADRIDGGNGNDLISGGQGADEITGGEGADVILSGHSLTLSQRQSAQDSYTPPAGGQLQVGGPTWGRYYDPATRTVVIGTGVGSSTANSGAGQSKGDHIDAGAGDDWVVGSDAADTVLGGQGKDAIWGGGGGDVLLGGTEADYLHGDGYVDGNSFNTTAAHLHGNDLITGGSGNDTLIGAGGADQLLGGTEDDVIWGDNNADHVLDGAFHGQDVLAGEEGKDQLVGGGGDWLDGGSGINHLHAGVCQRAARGAWALDGPCSLAAYRHRQHQRRVNGIGLHVRWLRSHQAHPQLVCGGRSHEGHGCRQVTPIVAASFSGKDKAVS